MPDHMQIDPGAGGRRESLAANLLGAKTRSKGWLNAVVKILIFLAVWIILMRFVLPRLGVPT